MISRLAGAGRQKTLVPGAPEPEVTEAKLEEAKLHFSGLMAGDREWVPAIF